MAAFNFPNSPSTNDLHTENNVTWKWNGTVWKRIHNSYLTSSTLDVSGIGTFGGNLNIADTIVHTGDTNTKIRFPAADTVTAEVGGVELLRVNSSGVSIKNSTNTSAFCVGNIRGTASAPSFNETNHDGLAVDVYNEGNPYERHISLAARGYGTSVADMSFWTDSGSSVAERLRITSAGRVGINETSPDTDLHIKNTNPSIILEGTNGSGRQHKIWSAGGNSTALQLTSGELYYNADSHYFRASNETTEYLRIDSSGRVLIGTTTVGAASYGDTLTIASSTSAGMTIRSGTSNYSSIYFADGTSGDDRKRGLIEYYHASANNMRFYTDAQERLRIDSTGWMGAGQTSRDHAGQVAAFKNTSNANSWLSVNVNNNTGVGGIVFGDSDTWAPAYIQYSHTHNRMEFVVNAGERLRIDSSGCVRVGNTATQTTSSNTKRIALGGKGSIQGWVSGQLNGCVQLLDNYYWDGSNNKAIEADHCAFLSLRSGTLRFGSTNSTQTAGQNVSGGINERVRISSGGQVTIGNNLSQNSRLLYVETTHSSGGEVAYFGNSDSGNYGGLVISAGEIDREVRLESAWGESFITFWTQHGSAGERLRITSTGNVTTCGTSSFSRANPGVTMRAGDALSVTRNGGCPLEVNRGTNDGHLVIWYQNNSSEGSIDVSGSSVSYNGGVLTRWSQLVGISTNVKSDRPTIYQGTVMSNLDEMCEWTDEDNMQLNKTQVSTASGDKKVAGVFWGWDDDDDVYTNDFFVAQTGDFIVRVAGSVTVENGDLLESAGDGTAKPQSDDIIRSKTLGKISSGIAYTTYVDGSKAYPCVLMAC